MWPESRSGSDKDFSSALLTELLAARSEALTMLVECGIAESAALSGLIALHGVPPVLERLTDLCERVPDLIARNHFDVVLGLNQMVVR